MPANDKLTAVELFAGAGGLGIAISNSGFRPLAVVEKDPYCCQTLAENKVAGVRPVHDWPDVTPTDVRDVHYSSVCEPDIDLLSAGPPCQPFSLGGKHAGHRDSRDMFPQVTRAVRELRPKAVLVENVRGLVRPSFATYFEYIQLQLRHPDLVRKTRESWREHLERLEKHHTSGAPEMYRVVSRVLNAADFGVPQRRDRVFIVGLRVDLGLEWSFDDLKRTHSLDALLYDQFVTGDYWKRHGLKRPGKSAFGMRNAARIRRLRDCPDSALREKPWRTVRDALDGLPDPRSVQARRWRNHVYNPGARRYPGHTGSPYDLPAKTLKAGDHGVPGGENMLAHPNGRVRYFTVRESARLQCFPDDFIFHGSWSETMRQLGNAVPVKLGEAIVHPLRCHLSGFRKPYGAGYPSLQSARQETSRDERGRRCLAPRTGTASTRAV